MAFLFALPEIAGEQTDLIPQASRSLRLGQRCIPRTSRTRSPEAPASARQFPQRQGRRVLFLPGIPAYRRPARKYLDRPVTPEVAGSSPVAPVAKYLRISASCCWIRHRTRAAPQTHVFSWRSEGSQSRSAFDRIVRQLSALHLGLPRDSRNPGRQPYGRRSLADQTSNQCGRTSKQGACRDLRPSDNGPGSSPLTVRRCTSPRRWDRSRGRSRASD
jgi:hypothetical protein